MQELQAIIEEAFERRAEITPRNVDPKLKDAVFSVIDMLDKGQLRVAERTGGQNWITHQWIKKAVLLSFRLEDNAFIKGGFTNYYDKVPSKFADYNSRDFREGGFRVDFEDEEESLDVSTDVNVPLNTEAKKKKKRKKKPAGDSGAQLQAGAPQQSQPQPKPQLQAPRPPQQAQQCPLWSLL